MTRRTRASITPDPRNRERGAVLIQVAVALTVLGGFCALAIDYGVLWVARSQAQNAADAAAIAGATSLAFDSGFDTGRAEQVARETASRNVVWTEPPVVSVEFPFTCDAVADVPPVPPGVGLQACMRANVFRNAASGNALPTFFARLFGVDEQGVRAQAMATSSPANSTSCVWPIAVADRWVELNEGNPLWNPSNSFVKYAPSGPPTLAATPDTYTPPVFTPPDQDDKGSGFVIDSTTLNSNTSLTLTPAGTVPLSGAQAPDYTNPIQGGQFVPVAIPRKDGGGFADNLGSCNGLPMTISTTSEATWLQVVDPTVDLSLDPARILDQVIAAADARRGLDVGASWNNVALRIQNSCATSNPPCANISPRLVVLPVFDTNVYEDTRWTGNPLSPYQTPKIKIVNFVGLFISDPDPGGSAVLGNLATYPGDIVAGKPQVGYLSAFLRTAVLYR